MPTKEPISQKEWAEIVGGDPQKAEELYGQLLAHRKAKGKHAAKDVLHYARGLAAGLAGKPAPEYQRDWMTKEEVEAKKFAYITEIGKIEEAKRKDAESYRRSILSLAASVYSARSGISKAKLQGELQLLELRTKALEPNNLAVGGGGESYWGNSGR